MSLDDPLLCIILWRTELDVIVNVLNKINLHN